MRIGETEASAIERALVEERRRNGLFLASLRLVVAPSIAAAHALGGAVVGQDLPYAAGAVGLFFLARRFPESRLIWLALPLFDVLLVAILPTVLQLPTAPDPFRLTYFMIMPLLCFLVASQGSLAPGVILATGSSITVSVFGLLAYAAFLTRSGDGVSRFAAVAPQVVICLVAATAISVFLCQRTRHLASRAVVEQAARERLNRYFSPAVAARIEATGAGELLPETVEVTVLFTDVRGFTALAETLGAREVAELLSELHGAMAEVVFRFGGTLDKFLGDGLLCYFGAPLPQPDHASRAVSAALEMRRVLSALNQSRTSRGEPPLELGAGLHTGTVVVGDIGPPERREFTIVGDTVNVASRLEGATKEFGTPIVVSAATRAAAGDAFEFREVGSTTLRGKKQPQTIYAPAHPAGG